MFYSQENYLFRAEMFKMIGLWLKTVVHLVTNAD